MDYRKRWTEHAPILIDGAVVEQVESFKFLGVHITNKPVVKRARQSLFPLRKLKRFVMGPQILKRFYSCNIESILTGCITAWYSNFSASNRKALQRVVLTGKAACHPGPLHQAVSEEGPKNSQRPQPPQS